MTNPYPGCFGCGGSLEDPSKDRCEACKREALESEAMDREWEAQWETEAEEIYHDDPESRLRLPDGKNVLTMTGDDWRRFLDEQDRWRNKVDMPRDGS